MKRKWSFKPLVRFRGIKKSINIKIKGKKMFNGNLTPVLIRDTPQLTVFPNRLKKGILVKKVLSLVQGRNVAYRS